ncbi:hypothetical protein PLICRDRAFT_41684 [Plicaturopsis crispa FD-325 SS-3]|nr:hypothetical protein PLICRDRAFT_41684 [Plicaturopsis crispa FD-325 SS-3]
MQPIVLWRPKAQASAEDATVLESVLSPQDLGVAPYSIGSQRVHRRVPSLGWFCLTRMTAFPDEFGHALGTTRLSHHPERILQEVFPSYKPGSPLALSQVDPRLWALLVQLYPSSLPTIFDSYPIPLSDPHLPLLQRIPSTTEFALVTVLDLTYQQQLTDDTVVYLRQLRTLAALDISETSISVYGVKVLSRSLESPLRILSLRDCWKIDDEVLPSLMQFPLLSVIDLRGTQCTPRATAKGASGFSPATDPSLYHPTPIHAALQSLSEAPNVHSSAHVFYLHVNALHHPAPLRSRKPSRPQPASAGSTILGSRRKPGCEMCGGSSKVPGEGHEMGCTLYRPPCEVCDGRGCEYCPCRTCGGWGCGDCGHDPWADYETEGGCDCRRCRTHHVDENDFGEDPDIELDASPPNPVFHPHPPGSTSDASLLSQQPTPSAPTHANTSSFYQPLPLPINILPAPSTRPHSGDARLMLFRSPAAWNYASTSNSTKTSRDRKATRSRENPDTQTVPVERRSEKAREAMKSLQAMASNFKRRKITQAAFPPPPPTTTTTINATTTTTKSLDMRPVSTRNPFRRPPAVETGTSTSLPEPSTSLPKPSTSLPKPTTSLPKPTTSLLKPTTSLPKPTTSLPKPTNLEPPPPPPPRLASASTSLKRISTLPVPELSAEVRKRMRDENARAEAEADSQRPKAKARPRPSSGGVGSSGVPGSKTQTTLSAMLSSAPSSSRPKSSGNSTSTAKKSRPNKTQFDWEGWGGRPK